MNVRKIHRPLAVAAVTGALLVGAPGLAQADDSSESRNGNDFSSPIEIGGLTFDSEQRDSSRDHDRDTDGGDRDRSSRSDESSTDYRFDSGRVTVDPNGSFSRDSASRDDDDGDESSERSRTHADGGLPVHVEGPSGWFRQHDENGEGSFESDEGDASSESSTREGSFDLGTLVLDPYAALSGEESSSEDDEDSSDVSRNGGELGSPYHYSGGHGWVSQEQHSGETNRDQDSTDQESSHSGQKVGGELGEASGDPSAWFLDESAQSEGGDDSASGERQRFGYDAPYSFDGFWTFVEQEQSDGSRSSDDDESSSSDDVSRERRELGFDGFSGHPQEAYDTEDLQQNDD